MYCCRVLPTVTEYHGRAWIVKHKYSGISKKYDPPQPSRTAGDALLVNIIRAAPGSAADAGAERRPAEPRTRSQAAKQQPGAGAPPEKGGGNCWHNAAARSAARDGSGGRPPAHARRRCRGRQATPDAGQGAGGRPPPRQPGNDSSQTAAAAGPAADARRSGAPLLRLPAFDMTQQKQPD